MATPIHPYQHREAFCLMEYQPQDQEIEKLGPGEIPETRSIIIWNSRDGVTPFCCSIEGIEYQHVNWNRDFCDPYHVPKVGDYIFIDCDREAWEAIEKAKIEEWWNHPEYPLSARYETKEQALEEFMKEFRPGQPLTVKVDGDMHSRFVFSSHWKGGGRFA